MFENLFNYKDRKIKISKKKSLAASYFPANSSIIGVRELDFRVRNGNGYYLSTMTTRQKYLLKTKCAKPNYRCTQDEQNHKRN